MSCLRDLARSVRGAGAYAGLTPAQAAAVAAVWDGIEIEPRQSRRAKFLVGLLEEDAQTLHYQPAEAAARVLAQEWAERDQPCIDSDRAMADLEMLQAALRRWVAAVRPRTAGETASEAEHELMLVFNQQNDADGEQPAAGIRAAEAAARVLAYYWCGMDEAGTQPETLRHDVDEVMARLWGWNLQIRELRLHPAMRA